MKNKLGLPLEYSKLAEYYDDFSLEGHKPQNQIIDNIFKEHDVQSVLDLTCGTGFQAFWLKNRGYQVTGVDLSPELLQIAKKKADKEKVEISFLQGDMRTIQVGQFDAVITIFNSIGHLTKEDFEETVRNIRGNLKIGGIYIFDIFNASAMSDELVKGLATRTEKTMGKSHIKHLQHSVFDKDKKLLVSDDLFEIYDGERSEVMKEHFALQTYTAQELLEILTKNGFEVLRQTSIDGSELIESESSNILTVALKNVP